MTRTWTDRGTQLALACGTLAWLGATACSPAAMAGAPRGSSTRERFLQLEQRYADARDLYAQIRITEARGATRSAHDSPLSDLEAAYEVERTSLIGSLASLDSTQLGGDDRRAYRTMRLALDVGVIDSSATPAMVSCAYDPGALSAGEGGFARLGARIYECFGQAARSIVIGKDTLDRLTIVGRLESEEDPVERHRYFMALLPLWLSMDGDNGPTSPYRTLVKLAEADWRTNGSYIASQARSLDVDSAHVEPMLVEILEAWRDRNAAAAVEPWDWWYANGAASRKLSVRVTTEALRALNDRYYADVGAEPTSLGIHYDLAPRDGKTPVAFTDFGAYPRRERGRWTGIEPWVFATYRAGGLANLSELLHETGHAIHIAAIRTRPAWTDWPDSDPFTEALGDLLALDVTEPEWQQKYLGDSATTAEAMRGRYGGIVLDVAWALFELRMLADPSRDPNATWADITSTYLRIAPHPGLAWWAMRGQLVDQPGYMLTYALAAIAAADLRAQIVADHGPFWRGDRRTYDRLSSRFYRWGLERPTREVLRDFLGRAITTNAILRDMQRLSER